MKIPEPPNREGWFELLVIALLFDIRGNATPALFFMGMFIALFILSVSTWGFRMLASRVDVVDDAS